MMVNTGNTFQNDKAHLQRMVMLVLPILLILVMIMRMMKMIMMMLEMMITMTMTMAMKMLMKMFIMMIYDKTAIHEMSQKSLERYIRMLPVVFQNLSFQRIILLW